MKYVDDLREYVGREDEIQRKDFATEIQSIVHCPKADPRYMIVVVFCNGRTEAYYVDGTQGTNQKQYFIIKPKKVRYLRTIKELVEAGYDPVIRIVGDTPIIQVIGHEDLSVISNINNLGRALEGISHSDEWLEIFTTLKEESDV